ncbi:aminotransferase class III-fold pyridoxal phosphate-dependent enzyme [Paenibacillus albiflavus]|uniref:Aminotransferase class III-fold pyridoxal phosphate-dependent enzyme n=1 Tax=Paenibacillus albiflavus TaxID=2545760 RepID=A0A4R4EE53_9BACL|nr:aminotransferase class III-fold pyridoxal phosphate-dependent enzyme [Paenibacillus albiflavus]TCZ76308.1 aminotransferase class III-fold pyridoxal phosphate-dependent enzyme [Paenibacillus albiflavus]
MEILDGTKRKDPLQKHDPIFHRDFSKKYPVIDYGKGVYLFDTDSKKYLDASSGAVAANLGHGIEAIADAMAEQAKKAAFVHTLRFETQVQYELAREISDMAPDPLRYVYFTSGGSEANESALKLARQYHRDRGNKEKYLNIGRWQSYHGNTMGSLSVGGDVKRRQPYTPSLIKTDHVYSPYCHRCPYHQNEEHCGRSEQLHCVGELERLIIETGPEFISSFICEPIVGSQQGAVVPPEDYLKQVRALCDRYDILMIVDEVMTGFGRTGTHFAIEQFGAIPDILTFGKGVSGGYAPLAGMIVSEHVVESLKRNGQGKFIHGFTFSGHPVSVAAGLAAVRYYKDQRVLDNCRKQGEYLVQALQVLQARHRSIGQIRGRGLLVGFELMKDRDQDVFYPPEYGASELLNQQAMKLGAIFYPGAGTIDGKQGDHLLIGPPLTITSDEMNEVIHILDLALTEFEQLDQV